MATEYTAQVTFLYDDLATRNVNFTDVEADALNNFKGNVMNFNDTLGDETATMRAAYRDTFTSDDGAPLARISKAKYTATESTVIYNGD